MIGPRTALRSTICLHIRIEGRDTKIKSAWSFNISLRICERAVEWSQNGDILASIAYVQAFLITLASGYSVSFCQGMIIPSF